MATNAASSGSSFGWRFCNPASFTNAVQLRDSPLRYLDLEGKFFMNTHTTTVHAKCPYLPVWDYYTITFSTAKFIKCETIEAAADRVRGIKATQEDIALKLRKRIPKHVKIKVVGRHGANCLTEITR